MAPTAFRGTHRFGPPSSYPNPPHPTHTLSVAAGVSIEALERAAAASGKASAVRSVARSGTALLVKNLPFTADEDELAAMFGRCGPLARLVLPPARALAVVEFSEPQDARAAFRCTGGGPGGRVWCFDTPGVLPP